MGHVLFVLLHLAALAFGLWGLLFTIPLHLIYAAVRASRTAEPPQSFPGPGDIAAGAVPTVRCPDCRELVRGDARKCKHCGSALTPVVNPGTK
ncbi:MAG: zinc ribbon domain-containing protein [Burkholderiaceae bacterium]|jgi:hypothetical protein|nr:zinc ribbon domain-containing protein [Burkholderiaceae bacterium]MCU0964062.1 zinc ribbon domain-containing protein [Burkholderiaceae bacterium]